MSTQVRFDLDGLTSAIESGDLGYRLALYADTAEVRVIAATNPSAVEVLRGKGAIGAWINKLQSQGGPPKVVNRVIGNGRVAMVEEQQEPDGSNVVYVSSAEICRGQIIKETVTRTENRLVSAVDSDDPAPPGQETSIVNRTRRSPLSSDSVVKRPPADLFGQHLPPSMFLG